MLNYTSYGHRVARSLTVPTKVCLQFLSSVFIQSTKIEVFAGYLAKNNQTFVEVKLSKIMYILYIFRAIQDDQSGAL